MSTSVYPTAGPATGNRYHSLDALRAVAMLMGILLHVAWLFIPYESGAPIMDVAANQPCSYIFYLTHIFRMQVFYLLAGFFARLVFLRLGYKGFAWHRFSRIAIPFGVGWLIMYPLFTLYWVWGGIQSGRIIMTEHFWSFVLSRMLADELSWFSLTHLWFLYYLLLIYVLAIATELLFKHVLDRSGVLRQTTGTMFGWAMRSRLNVLWLSIPLWFSLWWIGDWFGITTPSDSLRPHVPVLVAYSYFFFIGWLLHGQTHLLSRFTQGWELNLACGLVISVPLFLFFTRGNAEGYITWQYPMVFNNEILDYAAIRSAVRSADASQPQPPFSFVQQGLSPEWQQFVAETAIPTLEQKVGLATELSLNVVFNPTAFQPQNGQDRELLQRLKTEAARRGHSPIHIDASTTGSPLENRWLLEASLPPGTFAKNIVIQSWYPYVVALFSAAYSLGTWFLIFGLMGLFMRYFANPSPFVRYMADSSYWLYIVHLPILCQINVLVAEYRSHWLPKTMVYTAITFAIMMPSYHYLVRSTWLGKVLNGRTYPFRPWFRRPTTKAALDGPLQPETVNVTDT